MKSIREVTRQWVERTYSLSTDAVFPQSSESPGNILILPLRRSTRERDSRRVRRILKWAENIDNVVRISEDLVKRLLQLEDDVLHDRRGIPQRELNKLLNETEKQLWAYEGEVARWFREQQGGLARCIQCEHFHRCAAHKAEQRILFGEPRSLRGPLFEVYVDELPLKLLTGCQWAVFFTIAAHGQALTGEEKKLPFVSEAFPNYNTISEETGGRISEEEVALAIQRAKQAQLIQSYQISSGDTHYRIAHVRPLRATRPPEQGHFVKVRLFDMMGLALFGTMKESTITWLGCVRQMTKWGHIMPVVADHEAEEMSSSGHTQTGLYSTLGHLTGQSASTIHRHLLLLEQLNLASRKGQQRSSGGQYGASTWVMNTACTAYRIPDCAAKPVVPEDKDEEEIGE